MTGSDVSAILLAAEQAELQAQASPRDAYTGVWPTRIIGIGPLDDIQWYALTTTGVKSPLYRSAAEAEDWARQYNQRKA